VNKGFDKLTGMIDGRFGDLRTGVHAAMDDLVADLVVLLGYGLEFPEFGTLYAVEADDASLRSQAREFGPLRTERSVSVR
jgi:hypothetical protein